MSEIVSYSLLFILGLGSLFFYKRKVSLFQMLPFALVVGLAFLLFGRYSDTISQNILPSWSGLPAVLINVVFATLFIGKKIISPRQIWKFAGPQVVFGQTLAWGQYVVGAILTLFVLVPVFNMSPLSAALIEISFEGGHGTAAGLSNLFAELDFQDGADLALGLATVGIASGLATGLILTAWQRNKTEAIKAATTKPRPPFYNALHGFLINTRQQYFARHSLIRTITQLILVGIAIMLGSGIRYLLLGLELLLVAPFTDIRVVEFIPLFPLAMIGGIILQMVVTRVGLNKLVHGKTIGFTGNLALELVIITAIATMSLGVISANLVPFILLAVVGIVWNLVVFLLLAPRLMGRYWFERGIGDYGQSMGMTATGLLLMKTADPSNKAHAMERFGYKQLLFEPVVGGGIFTALSMILISQLGLVTFLVLCLAVLLFWLIVGWKSFGYKNNPQSH